MVTLLASSADRSLSRRWCRAGSQHCCPRRRATAPETSSTPGRLLSWQPETLRCACAEQVGPCLLSFPPSLPPLFPPSLPPSSAVWSGLQDWRGYVAAVYYGSVSLARQRLSPGPPHPSLHQPPSPPSPRRPPLLLLPPLLLRLPPAGLQPSHRRAGDLRPHLPAPRSPDAGCASSRPHPLKDASASY